jgi:hypothetical protein
MAMLMRPFYLVSASFAETVFTETTFAKTKCGWADARPLSILKIESLKGSV